MDYSKPYVSPDYLFKWEPEKNTLFFITQGAHASGTALKNFANVQPHILEELVSIVNSSKPAIGSVITIRNYIFVVSRKHYSSKHDLDLVLKALNEISHLSIKMSNEDFPTIVDLVEKHFPAIEIKKTSNWDDGHRVDL
jgi:hypothetical protein